MAPGAITKFPAEGLRHARRFITSHNEKGQGVFVVDDDGDHHRIMVQGEAVANIIYSTKGAKVDLNDEKDLKYAKEKEVLYSLPPFYFHLFPPIPYADFLTAGNSRARRQRRSPD